MREPIHDDVIPTRLHRLQRGRVNKSTAATLAAGTLLLGILVGGQLGGEVVVPTADAATVARQAADPASDPYMTTQQKKAITLVREVRAAEREVVGHHRHHSQVMWDYLDGKINGQEAWWRGGVATCEGWLAANRAEVAQAKLEGRAAHPRPLPKRAEEFCEQARERR